jgi:hypothetical protein
VPNIWQKFGSAPPRTTVRPRNRGFGNTTQNRLTTSDPPTQAEVQALRDKCEELADDVRALPGLVHALRGAGSCRVSKLLGGRAGPKTNALKDCFSQSESFEYLAANTRR